MSVKKRIKKFFNKLSGYWFCKERHLPVGCDLISDLKYKIDLSLNTIFDVGANIGQTATRFHRDFNTSMIYSFEPVTEPFDQLQQHTKSLKRVNCFKLAMGDKNDLVEIDVYEGDESVLNSLKKEVQNKTGNLKETIKVITGDDFCEEYNISEIDLLKIDTEGYEIQVLDGFKRMLNESRIKAIYCEVGFNMINFRNTYINNMMDFAEKNDFIFFGLYETKNIQIKKNLNFGNILFLHKDTVADLT